MRRFLDAIFTVLIAVLLTILIISFTVKDICVNTLSDSVVKSEVTSKIIDNLKEEYPEISYTDMSTIETNISNSTEIEKITSKYFDNLLSTIENKGEISVPDTKEELTKILEENESTLNDFGIDLTESNKNKIIDELASNGRLDKVYKSVATSISENVSDEQKSVIKTYDILTSSDTRIIIVISIIALLVLIMLVKKSFYKWILSISISLFLSGMANAFIIPAVVQSISNRLTSGIIGMAANINLNVLANYGYITIAISACLFIIYFVINKLVIKRKKKLDY